MAQTQLAKMLEREVAAIRLWETKQAEADQASRSHSVEIDNHYHRIFELLGPRMAWLIRRYGLVSIRPDAEQACAIGVMRAVRAWDPARASFATLAHWQMRGELQSLRHRMMPDMRQGARAAGRRTISWHNSLGEVRPEIAGTADASALAGGERAASDTMARRLLDKLLDRIAAPEGERRIVGDAIFGDAIFGDAASKGLDRQSRERNRQIVRRTFRNCAKVVAG